MTKCYKHFNYLCLKVRDIAANRVIDYFWDDH